MSEPQVLAGRVALVTGGGSGIGRATALLFARSGARVAVADRNVAGAEETCAAVAAGGGTSLALEFEVADSVSVDAMVARTLAAYGQIDVLAHCPGIGGRTPVIELSDTAWHHVVDVNLSGTFYTARAVARAMVERKSGTMILIASDRGLLGAKDQSAYAASKAGVIGFAKSLALELGAYGITVNALNPGTTDTPLIAGMPPALRKQRLATDPLGKLSQPEEIAELILFLATSGGRFMTGQLLTTRMRSG